MTIDVNQDLVRAFPAAILDDAAMAASRFPEPKLRIDRAFVTHVSGQEVCIPQRIYRDPTLIELSGLTSRQLELVCCLLTRHHDGYIRQAFLEWIVSSNSPWVPPFVIQLVGEYVIEILDIIERNLGSLDRNIYGQFVRANPQFIAITERRVMSYWNEYFRPRRRRIGFLREHYVGFRLMRSIKNLASGDLN
jgi:hypothetical protein